MNLRTPLALVRLQDYLKRRRYHKGYCHRIVGSNVEKWAEFWEDKDNQNEMNDHITSILIEHTESKARISLTPREEYWFRIGLSKLPALYEACIATREEEKRKLKKEQAKQVDNDKDNK